MSLVIVLALERMSLTNELLLYKYIYQLALFRLRERGLLERLDEQVKSLIATGLGTTEALMLVSF